MAPRKGDCSTSRPRPFPAGARGGASTGSAWQDPLSWFHGKARPADGTAPPREQTDQSENGKVLHVQSLLERGECGFQFQISISSISRAARFGIPAWEQWWNCPIY